MVAPQASSTPTPSRKSSKAPASSSAKKSKPTPTPDALTSHHAFPLAGTIGVAGSDGLNHGMSAGGGARRTLPEIVVTYRLPLLHDVEGNKADDAQPSSPQPEQSLILLQSLRQSRLMHLTALLPPFSQRVRNGMVYPGTCSIPNLDPKQPHVLIQLGRADIRIGPHVFPRTKFWEARQERPVATASATGGATGGATGSASTSPVKQVVVVRPSPSVAPGSASRQPITRPPAPRSVAPHQSASASPSSSRPPAPRPTSQQTRPPSSSTAPQVDEALVIRVNQKAAVEPELRQLLHLAATGSASSQQLRALGGWIQVVTEELKREGTTLHAPSLVQAGLATPRVGGPVARPPTAVRPASTPSTPGSSAPPSVGPSTPRPAQAPPSVGPSTPRPAQAPLRPAAASQPPPRPAAVRPTPTSSPQAARPALQTPSTAAAAAVPKRTAVVPSPTRPAPAAPAPKGPPPILVVEFRENPSMRFLLPLWRGAAVERRSGGDKDDAGEAEVALTFMLPALGSEAGGGKAMASVVEAEEGKQADKASVETDERSARKYERYAATWRIRNVVSESMWEAFGRCALVKTVGSKGENESGGGGAKEKEGIERDRLAKEFVELLKAMPKLGNLAYDAPLPVGLEEHLSDKFLPRAVRLSSRPSVKRKGAGDDVEGGVAVGSGALGGSGRGESGGGMEKKPKRQRHVATHNKDGSLKRCEACGTNSTPLWRRGPRGPSTLCNACGGRYKAGRLVLPAVPPTGPIETDKDQSSTAANAANTSSEAKATSSAVVPEQSTGPTATATPEKPTTTTTTTTTPAAAP